jgi:hypothetical protein
VREEEHAGAPGFQELAGLIELQDRRFGTAREGVAGTSVDDVDAAVGGRLDCSDSGPFRANGRLRPVANGAVGIGEVVQRGGVVCAKAKAAAARARSGFIR